MGNIVPNNELDYMDFQLLIGFPAYRKYKRILMQVRKNIAYFLNVPTYHQPRVGVCGNGCSRPQI